MCEPALWPGHGRTPAAGGAVQRNGKAWLRLRRPLAGLTLLMGTLTAGTSCMRPGAPWTFVENGKSCCTIVVSSQPQWIRGRDLRLAGPEPREPAREAALFLQAHIAKVTDCTPPIVTGDGPIDGTAIYVGRNPALIASSRQWDRLEPEGFAIFPAPGGVAIVGEKDHGVDRGLWFGVYEFLERAFGVRWYFVIPRHRAAHVRSQCGLAQPGIVIPRKTTVRIRPFAISKAPAYRMRCGGVSYYTGAAEHRYEWHPVLRFGMSETIYANHTQGGWTALYGTEFPEYFALSRSRSRRIINRRYPHRSYLCWTNPDVLRRMLEHIERFDRDGWREPWGAWQPRGNVIHFCPNDGMTPETLCHCDACRPLHRPGTPKDAGYASELIFRFVARYADAIAAHWPQRRLHAAAYGYYRLPPTGVEIPANVDISLCLPNMPLAYRPQTRAEMQQLVRGWTRKLGGDRERLAVWNYNTLTRHFGHVPALFPKTLAWWHRHYEHKLIGAFINGANPYHRAVRDSASKAYTTYLMTWLWHQVMWDPDADVYALMQRFCTDLFGPAGTMMCASFRAQAEAWETYVPGEEEVARQDSGRFLHELKFPENRVAEIRTAFAEAKAAVPPDSDFHRRLVWFETVYAHFFRESQLYHRWTGRELVLEAAELPAPPLAGATPVPTVWENVRGWPLVTFDTGDTPAKPGLVRLGTSVEHLWVCGSYEKPADTESLRIHIARGALPLEKVQSWALNLDPGKYAEHYAEFAIDASGAVVYAPPGLARQVQGAAWRDGDRLHLLAGIPLRFLRGIGGQASDPVRIQVVRYWDQWNDFTMLSPAATLSEYDPSRFYTLTFPVPDAKSEWRK